MAAAYSWIAVGAIVFAGLLTAAYYVATVPFAASTDWPTLVGQQADAAHLSRFSEVLGWLRREKDELAGGEGLPRTEQVLSLIHI